MSCPRVGSSVWRAAAYAILLVSLLPGCARPPPPERPLPAGLVGAEIELLHVPIRAIRAVVDAGGTGHVISVGEDNQLYHVTITPGGVVATELLGPIEDGARLGIAADSVGGTHILAGGRYLSGGFGRWKSQNADRCEQIVAAGPDIVCAFKISGRDVGSPMEFGLLFLPGGLPVPLLGRPDKIVVAKEESNGWRPFAVIEPESHSSTILTGLVGDRKKRLHLTYDRPGIVMAPTDECRYTDFVVSDDLVTTTSAVAGTFCPDDSFVVAAADHSVMLVWRKLDRVVFRDQNGIFRSVPGPPDPSCLSREAAGYDGASFHIIAACLDNFWSMASTGATAVYYTRYSDGTWTTPVRLVPVGALAFGAARWEPEPGFRIASGMDGRALAVMALRGNRLVARWIGSER